MSTDRELLELAAKAAGIEVLHPDLWPRGTLGLWIKRGRHNTALGWWNPLNDDGDALRLAVQLNIWPVRQFDRDVICVQNGAAYYDVIDVGADEPIGDDPCAATRRAIVRAAAEMGRTS
jgi:hypothetical protein